MDKYIKPTSPIIDYHTRYSGLREKDLINAPNFNEIK